MFSQLELGAIVVSVCERLIKQKQASPANGAKKIPPVRGRDGYSIVVIAVAPIVDGIGLRSAGSSTKFG